MKTNDLNPTRFACRIVRWSNALAGGAGGEIRKFSAHGATCADCQKFFAVQAQLESELRFAAGEMGDRPEDDFEERILRGVRKVRPAARPTVRFGHPLIPLAGVVAGVVFAIILLGRIPPKPTGTGQPLVAGPGVIAPAAPENSWTWNMPDSLRVAVKGNPLQNELESVYSDAQSALNFLALNFLPTAAPDGSPTARENARAAHSG